MLTVLCRAKARTRAFALLLLFAAAAPGCRDLSGIPVAPLSPAPPLVVLTAGDSLMFYSWPLDQFGNRILSLQTGITWHVLSTGESYRGKDGVTTILEVASPGSPPIPVDTLRFRFGTNGDIEQFGFLAQAARRRDGQYISPGWDRVAAFSLAVNTTWSVGALDTAGIEFVRGEVVDDRSYFSLGINEVQTLVRGYSVSLSAIDFGYTLTIADPPHTVMLLREESSPSHAGFVRILWSAYLSGWFP